MADVPTTRDGNQGTLPGIPHPGAVVAFAAAVFTGTLMAVFSAAKRSELGGWWLVAMVFVLLGWLAVAAAARIGKSVSDATGVMRRSGSLLAVMLWLLVAASLLLAVVALVLRLPPLGFVLSAMPILVVCAFFWARRLGVEGKVGGFAGVLLFLICIRLFTMPGDRDDLAPKFAGSKDDDLVMMTWNVGGGAPMFSAAGDGEIDKIAKVVSEQGAHVVCLQSVPSKEFLEALKVKLGVGWRGECSNGDGKLTAVLSQKGGVFQASSSHLAHGGPAMVSISSDSGVLNFVSCHAAPGRASAERRHIVDRVLSTVRSPHSKTVIAGDFGIDPGRGWSFLQPLYTDSSRFDMATWRAINVLGSDPGFGGAGTSPLGRRDNWVVVDSKMAITDYRVLESFRGGGIAHAPVVVRLGLGKAGRKMADPEPTGAPRGEMIERAL